ncbi:unnamed protein product, partial [Didymodactylos carnosus]
TRPARSSQSEDRISRQDTKTVKRRKARRRAKSAAIFAQEPSLLHGFEDEVIVEQRSKGANNILPDLLISSNVTKSTPANRIYFENKKTFSSVNKSTIDKDALRFATSAQLPYDVSYQQQSAEMLKRYTVQVAKQTHTFLQRLFLFIHGINAGYAFWIIDPVKFNRTVFFQSLSLQNSAVAILFYSVAMIVNLYMMQTDDYLRMTQYSNQTTIEDTVLTDVLIPTWKRLNAVRAAFIMIAWLVVTFHVKNDRLSTLIKNTEEKAFYEELRIEQNTAPMITGTNA